MRMMKAAVAALLAVQMGSAQAAVTGMKYISTAGDYIGGGITQTFLPPSASITATGTASVAQISVSDPNNWWYIDFASASDATLGPGTYPDAARYPFNSPMGAGLSMYGDGRGCNTSNGWFRIKEYAVDATGAVSKLAVDFVQNCEVVGPPLYGAVRINSSYALVIPEMAAVAGADFDVIEGKTATLDGSQSFSRNHPPLTYQWTQVGGPAVTLDNPSSMTPSFTAPAAPLSGVSLRFRLDVADATGKSQHDYVIVMDESAKAPRTEISFHGDPGDYITGGQSYDYNPGNAAITFSRNYDGGVSASISGDTWWYLDTASKTGTVFGPGVYQNAQRFPFQDANSPGLSLDGDGRGCNTLTGGFVVYKAKFDNQGNPTSLDMTFDQHCEGAAPAAYGEVLLNAVPHATVAAQLREAHAHYGR